MSLLPRYGQRKLDEGARYLDFCRRRLSPYGITFWSYDSPLFQLEGESLQGVECKLDSRCTDTLRLSVEVAEKSASDMPNWTPSGICKADNSWAYVQGNYEVIFVFSKKWLLRWYTAKTPETSEAHGTIRKFYLSLTDAHVGCVFSVDGDGKRLT
jgi:hypothetical protein